MTFWHIRILHQDKKHGSTSYSYEMDLSEDNAKTVAKQYQQGENLFFRGRWIDPFDIREILIRQTEEPSKEYETAQTTGSVEIFSHNRGMAVTRHFVSSPPRPKREIRKEAPKLPNLSKNIFIVHGRDTKPALELARILEGWALNPIILEEKPSMGRTIVEKLEKYSDVGFAFIILTPDDVGALTTDKQNLKQRARQNVILEFGYFTGLLGRDRVCCLHKGNVELPSDIYGIVYIPFKESVKEAHWYIVRELKAVGYLGDSF